MKKVAVVGFGFMGFTHAVNTFRMEQLSLAAIVERKRENIARNLREQTGNFPTGSVDPAALERVPVYSTLAECLDRESVDVVDVCLPTLYHYEATKLALDRGKDVLVEKPFGLDPAQCRELIRTAKQGGRILMVAHVIRFMAEYEFLKQAVTEGRYGRPRFLLFSRTTGAPAWGDWKADAVVRKASGGGLFDLMIHDVDFLNYLLGKPRSIDSLSVPGSLSDHDYVNARWLYEDATAVIEGGMMFHVRHPFQAGYLVRFEDATVEFSSRNPGAISVATDTGAQVVRVDTEPDGFYREIEYFAKCVETRTWPEKCPPEASLEAVELCRRHMKSMTG